MKIGVLGGTFDPVHSGHTAIADLAVKELCLDKVLLIPNSIPPHKNISTVSNAQKVKMLKLAFENRDNFEIDCFEINKKEVSYLYKTLLYLSEKYKNSQFYFLAGADNITEIRGWKNPDIILSLANVVFFKRPGFSLDENLIKKMLSDYNAKIKIIDFHGEDISSSVIRKNIKEYKSVKKMLPYKVFNYIIENGIYLNEVKDKLKKYLSKKKYNHSISVAKEAVKLARYYKLSEEKAYICGLLHDVAKELCYDKQIEIISSDNTFELMEDELKFPKVIHAVSGAIIARDYFGINDFEILNAIRFHTLGSIKMSEFDKIIYVADLISEDRKYKGIEIIKNLAYNNIDKAIIFSIENTISRLGDDLIQKDIIKLKNYLKEKN